MFMDLQAGLEDWQWATLVMCSADKQQNKYGVDLLRAIRAVLSSYASSQR